MNVHAGNGVAVREFPLARRHGYADYLLFVAARPVGALRPHSPWARRICSHRR
jgi:type I restriction enzyme R subunit